MADKATVTLYPPEHAADTETPIEVHPDMLGHYRRIGWREHKPQAEAEPEAPGTADPQQPRPARKRAAKTKES